VPITSRDTYVTTMDSLASHWTSVNEDGASPPDTDLRLAGGYTLALFQADRGVVWAALRGAREVEIGLKVLFGDRDALKKSLGEDIARFRAAIRAALPASSFAAALPRVPKQLAAEGRFLAACRGVAAVWAEVDALAPSPEFAPPLLLGGMTRADYQAKVDSLVEMFETVRAENVRLKIAREDRDRVLKRVRGRLLQYRDAVMAHVGPGHYLTKSVPRISPLPGSTPDAVEAAGYWDAEHGVAVIEWPPSENPKLDHYEVRRARGERYRADDETVVARVPADTHVLRTAAGLPGPGAEAEYRVYVVLKTGNEKGSNTVRIVRPM
jgi:hypothetical protein